MNKTLLSAALLGIAVLLGSMAYVSVVHSPLALMARQNNESESSMINVRINLFIYQKSIFNVSLRIQLFINTTDFV
jgi:hypothetical protein